MHILRKNWPISVCIFFLLTTGSAPSQAAPPLKSFFQIEDLPSKKDWVYFIKSETKWRRTLWQYYKKQGKYLKDWSWGWRMGWLRTCTTTNAKYCNAIFKQALFDEAAVVRGEAASKIGIKYAGSKSVKIINLLKKAYSNPRNLRRGKPLFVQQRILFSILAINGSYASKVGGNLAKSSRGNLDYWARISKIGRIERIGKAKSAKF